MIDMTYIVGDTHGNREQLLSILEQISKNDCLIISGDFGFIFSDNEQEKLFLDELEDRPYTICFCDGNHENFPAIYSYPKELWNGGYVHRIRKNVIHLMRGQVFTIEGKTVFTMGGAYSLDRCMRTLNTTYWDEELPSDEEYRTATQNLKEHGNKVDIIITHTAPRDIIRKIGQYPDKHDAELTGFLEWIEHEVQFDKWYFGHFHMDKTVDSRFTALYKRIIRAE